eukprot:Hpha_TRINITY_DN34058_c0_g1::TRINITY_DN34058_c0_g1_i1::g.30601::m.30601
MTMCRNPAQVREERRQREGSWRRSSCERFAALSIVTVTSRWARRSLALTRKSPSSVIEKDTLTFGTPAAACSIGRENFPSRKLFFAHSPSSPSYTRMTTDLCPSCPVVYSSLRSTGTRVARGISTSIEPSLSSTPRVIGVTCSTTTIRKGIATPPWGAAVVALDGEGETCRRLRAAAKVAAPHATASSGLEPHQSCLPAKKALRRDWISTIRVLPPTSTTSSIACRGTSASSRADPTSARALSNRSPHIELNSSSDSISSIPSASIIDSLACESSRFAASQLRRSLCLALTPSSAPGRFLATSLIAHSAMRVSKSSPPRWKSPVTASVTKLPCPSRRRTLTSNVPPPMSNTRTW